VAALLARAPSLATLQFSDGTALADAETRTWIQGLTTGGGGGGGAAAGAGAGHSAIDRAAAEAAKLAAEGNLVQAMSVLGSAANTTSPVDRFRARLEIGKLALQQQIVDMARANLETLERTAEEHRLAAWDPALCAELHESLYRLRRIIASSGSDPEIGEKLNRTYERLCELDVARAYQVLAEG
jgi:type VI secretion system protein VasJ